MRQAGEDVQGERERGEEEERGRTASRSAFYKSRVKGGATTQSDAPSSKSCPSIGSWPRPARLLGPEAASFAHPARRGLEPFTELPGPCSDDWMRIMSVQHARLGHPRRAVVGAVNVLGPSLCHAIRVAWAAQHPRLVANCIDEWRRGVIFPV